MVDMQSANPVTCGNALCGQDGWSRRTWFRWFYSIIGVVVATLFLMMEFHSYLDHGGQASTNELDAIKTLIESNAKAIGAIQGDVNLIQQILMAANRRQQSSDEPPPPNQELKRLQLRLQNTGVHTRGKPSR